MRRRRANTTNRTQASTGCSILGASLHPTTLLIRLSDPNHSINPRVKNFLPKKTGRESVSFLQAGKTKKGRNTTPSAPPFRNRRLACMYATGYLHSSSLQRQPNPSSGTQRFPSSPLLVHTLLWVLCAAPPAALHDAVKPLPARTGASVPP